MSRRSEEERIVWAAFELGPGGSVRARVTVEREGGLERRSRGWDSVDAAEAELGSSFGEVARKVRAAGSRRGRWRP